MKFLITLFALASVSVSAFASTTVLECRGNTLNGNPRRIEIQSHAVTVVFDNDSVMTGDDSTQNPNSSDIAYNVTGFGYSIPRALLNGRLKEANVGISSYDYPYENVSCTRQ